MSLFFPPLSPSVFIIQGLINCEISINLLALSTAGRTLLVFLPHVQHSHCSNFFLKCFKMFLKFLKWGGASSKAATAFAEKSVFPCSHNPRWNRLYLMLIFRDATYSSSDTEESAALRLYRLKEGVRSWMVHLSHGQLLHGRGREEGKKWDRTKRSGFIRKCASWKNKIIKNWITQ